MTEFKRPSGGPLIAVAVASFDMVTGIKVCYKCVAEGYDESENLMKAFKITLANVHRQTDQAFRDPMASTVEIPTINRFLVNEVFVISQKSRNVHYSVGLILIAENLPRNIAFINVLKQWNQVLVKFVKGELEKNLPVPNLGPIIEMAAEEMSVASRCSISELPPFELPSIDSRLLSRILTSHIGTKMATVIEAGKDPTEALKIAKFLSSFLLPHQRYLSTLDILPRPCPHLYLQIIEKLNPSDGLSIAEWMMFGRTVTWIRVAHGIALSRSPGQDENQAQIREKWIQELIKLGGHTDDKPRRPMDVTLSTVLRPRFLRVPGPWLPCTSLKMYPQRRVRPFVNNSSDG
jgi:hypothetical protein